MTDRFGYESKLLLGPAAGKRAIESAVKEAAEGLGPEDALIVFFAGHGQVIDLPEAGEAGFLIPHDAALDVVRRGRHTDWRDQAINVHDLFARASASPARHVLFVIDACRSGIATGRGWPSDRTEIRGFLTERGRAVLAATRRDQTAREDAARGHGYFTAAVLDRLKSDDAITTLDLYAHVSQAVSRATNGAMFPQFGQHEGDGMVVFIPKSIPKADIERDLQGIPLGPLAAAQARAAEALGQRTTAAELAAAFHAHDYRSAPDAEDQRKRWEGKFERFRRNAGLGDARAMAAVSLCYEKGLGTTADAAAAYEWAKLADRVRLPAGVGRWSLGRCQELGVGVAKNPAGAEKLFREAAADFSIAKLSLARLLSRRASADEKEIRSLLTAAEAAGVVEAGLDLADRLLTSAPADRPAALADARARYEKAAAAGHPRGELGLFLLFADGRPGFPARDTARAERHLRTAAEVGEPAALFHLGLAHIGDPSAFVLLRLNKDDTVTRELVERSARLGHPPAVLATVAIHGLGIGGPVDESLALRRLEEAVGQDQPRAYAVKGQCYRIGRLLPADAVKAAEWFERAARKGDPLGCAEHGQALWTGLGRGRRLSIAYNFHGDTHTAAHWLMTALLSDPDERDPETRSVALPLLEELVAGHNLVAQGIPIENLLPAEVFDRWNRAHPDTFAAFRARFRLRLAK